MMRRTLATWILLAFLFQIVGPTLAWAQSGTRFEVTIAARSLNVRSGPGTDFEILASVRQGDVVVGLREDAGWVQIELPDGTIGWVSDQYVRIGRNLSEPPPAPEPAQDRDETPAPVTPRQSPAGSGGGGGGGFGSVIKWTALIGAAALGGLAVNERMQGNDTYDEYEELALAGDAEAAEEKWEETADHDDKAQLYGIVAGGLFGLFLLQQFVFTGGSDSAEFRAPGEAPMGLAWNPVTGDVRATLVRIRF